MKNLYRNFSLILAFFVLANLSYGQITITNANMPSPGDTIRVSDANYPLSEFPDPTQTGFDYYWDFSSIEPVSQQVRHFISPTQTPFLYQLVFTPSVANLATPVEGLDFFDIQVSDAYEYYKNSSSEYVRAGYAANIMGIPVPMKYTEPERLLKFPLSQSSQPDSSMSELEIQYPGVAYFNLQKKRVNSVDGSGTLVTPYGTFNTLRVKSVIYERDSLYLDSIQAGVPIIRNIIEYRWFNPDYPLPLLTISAEGMVYTVQYIDSVRNIVPFVVDLGDDVATCQGNSVTLTAQVSGGEPPYTYLWSTMETTPSITVAPEETTTYSVLVTDSNMNLVSDNINVAVTPFARIDLGEDTLLCAEHSLSFNPTASYDEVTWFVNNVVKGTGAAFTIDSTGIGLHSVTLRVEFTKGQCTGSDEINITFYICDAVAEHQANALKILPNPAVNEIVIESPEPFNQPVVRICTLTGNTVLTARPTVSGSRIWMDISAIKQGTYIIYVSDNQQVITGKLVKK